MINLKRRVAAALLMAGAVTGTGLTATEASAQLGTNPVVQTVGVNGQTAKVSFSWRSNGWDLWEGKFDTSVQNLGTRDMWVLFTPLNGTGGSSYYLGRVPAGQTRTVGSIASSWQGTATRYMGIEITRNSTGTGQGSGTVCTGKVWISPTDTVDQSSSLNC